MCFTIASGGLILSSSHYKRPSVCVWGGGALPPSVWEVKSSEVEKKEGGGGGGGDDVMVSRDIINRFTVIRLSDSCRSRHRHSS